MPRRERRASRIAIGIEGAKHRGVRINGGLKQEIGRRQAGALPKPRPERRAI
jgi:RNase adaptor protein for sRNA GlmZ degradation